MLRSRISFENSVRGGDNTGDGSLIMSTSTKTIEQLESRRLLAYSYYPDSKLLIVVGTPGNDTILFQANAALTTYRLSDNGVVTNFAASSIARVEISGSSGKDTLSGAPSAAYPGQYTLGLILYGGSGNDTLIGNAGKDTLYGEYENDSLVGGSGHDSLDGGTGKDSISGGTGADTVSYATSPFPVRVSLDNIANDGATGELDYIDSTVENIVGSAYNDSLVGSAGGNVLNGGAGNDIVFGQDGNDTILGRDGNDTLFGDAGNDNILGDAGKDLIHGGLGNDSLTGGSAIDRLYGDEGNDTLMANDSAAADIVDGGIGTDKAKVDAGDVKTSIEVLL